MLATMERRTLLTTERRAQIVSAALDLFEAGGPDALTMRALADRVGIRAASLYRHFADKHAVEVAMIAAAFADQAVAAEAAIVGADRPLAAMGRVYRKWAIAHPHLYRLMTDRPLPRADLPEGLEARAAIRRRRRSGARRVGLRPWHGLARAGRPIPGGRRSRCGLGGGQRGARTNPRGQPLNGEPSMNAESIQVSPRIRRIGRGMVNSYLVEDGGEVTIVDAGAPAYWGQLPAELAAIGRSLDDVRSVVLTHGHSDHIGFAERIRSERGTPIRVHELDAALARGEVPNPAKGLGPTRVRPLLEFMLFSLRNGMMRIPRITEVATFGDGATLDVPGAPRVILVPGHTPGSAALLFGGHDALFVGDAMATHSVTTGDDGPRISPFTADSVQALASPARARPSLERRRRRRGGRRPGGRVKHHRQPAGRLGRPVIPARPIIPPRNDAPGGRTPTSMCRIRTPAARRPLSGSIRR